uniref:Transcription factor MYB21-like n=1 Tax=Nicotiana sylvestris TaxID=4096 RepID=A0A1U7WXV0_NICSY|nr:PREDICTED: transcription factor MYB21-like [Nicotiana sylvestris]
MEKIQGGQIQTHHIGTKEQLADQLTKSLCKSQHEWSKIAQYLPARTYNEIKNYWRTRVQKQARKLKTDSNSAAFQVSTHDSPSLDTSASSEDTRLIICFNTELNRYSALQDFTFNSII